MLIVQNVASVHLERSIEKMNSIAIKRVKILSCQLRVLTLPFTATSFLSANKVWASNRTQSGSGYYRRRKQQLTHLWHGEDHY